MIKIFVLILAVAGLALAEPLRLQAAATSPRGRQYLSHTKVVLDYYAHMQTSSLRRHNLADMQLAKSYEQLPLETNHFGFTLKLKVGGLYYKLSMDTGSADFFIKGQNSPGKPKRKYKSGEDYKNKQLVEIGYLDGDLDTYPTFLPVEFNGQKFNASVLVAYTAPKQFEDVEGLIGLSYPSLARHQPTFIQTLIKQNIISKYAFGMNLNLIQTNRSFVSFGQADSQLYEGKLSQYSIQKSKQISIDFNYVKIGNSQQLKIKRALLDTGNTCISIPRKFQKEILQQFNTHNNKCAFMVEENVPMFSLLVCRIENFDQLPTITLSIGQELYTIQKQYYIQKCTQNPKQKGTNTYYCDSYIESVDYPGRQKIFLGDAFFNRFYTYFDLEDQKVGIAKNRENITIKDILESQPFDYQSSEWTLLDDQY